MKIINKDITNVESGIIIQQVNCQGAMGSGVAKSLYLKYPKIRIKYLKLCEKIPKEERFGRLQVIPINKDIKVVNIFSQFDYGSSGKYTDEYRLINSIKKICEKYKNNIVYAPYKIGCGLGGGDWDKILSETSDIHNLVYCRIQD